MEHWLFRKIPQFCIERYGTAMREHAVFHPMGAPACQRMTDYGFAVFYSSRAVK
jgi:hypothetical protein